MDWSTFFACLGAALFVGACLVGGYAAGHAVKGE